MWRLCSSHVSSLAGADTACWSTVFDVLACLVETETESMSSIFEISVKAFRSIYLLLNAAELKDAVPYTIVQPMNAVLLVVAGVDGRHDSEEEEEGDGVEETWEFRNKMSIAMLDLLSLLHSRLAPSQQSASDLPLYNNWRTILDSISNVASGACVTKVRQHALGMLVDMILDRHGQAIPQAQLVNIIQHNAVDTAKERIADIMALDITPDLLAYRDDVSSELQACVNAVFRPVLQHLPSLMKERGFPDLWSNCLDATLQLLVDEGGEGGGGGQGGQGGGEEAAETRAAFHESSRDYAYEHLRNALLVLHAAGSFAEEAAGGLVKITRDRVGRIEGGSALMDFEANPNAD